MAKKATESPAPTENGQELSEKEMEAKKAEITVWYKDNIKHLKVQKEYEELLRDIEKLRAERLQAQQFIAQTMATQKQEAQQQAVADANMAQAQNQAPQSQAQQDWNPNMDTAPPRKLKTNA
jgi:ferric-dicitrate binding protein FerR (iron transport regulator)